MLCVSRGGGRVLLLNQFLPNTRVQVDEDEHKYTVKAEVPGFTKEDIKVTGGWGFVLFPIVLESLDSGHEAVGVAELIDSAHVCAVPHAVPIVYTSLPVSLCVC